jgi:hypothetical protein
VQVLSVMNNCTTLHCSGIRQRHASSTSSETIGLRPFEFGTDEVGANCVVVCISENVCRKCPIRTCSHRIFIVITHRRQSRHGTYDNQWTSTTLERALHVLIHRRNVVAVSNHRRPLHSCAPRIVVGLTNAQDHRLFSAVSLVTCVGKGNHECILTIYTPGFVYNSFVT